MRTPKSALVFSTCAFVLLSALGAPAGAIAGNPLIDIAGGSFVFGNEAGRDNEKPQQRLNLPPFSILKTEVTNAQYREFVRATGRVLPTYAAHPLLGSDVHPVVGVTWDDARAFCQHHGLRLPSERQYERAARGRDGAPYPWGTEEPTPLRVNHGARDCCAGDDRDGYVMTAPVGSYPLGASREGVLDLVGNVWEWTRDWYAPYAGPADPAIANKFRVLRGGSWNNGDHRLSTTYRLAYDPDFRYSANGGFRCVADGR